MPDTIERERCAVVCLEMQRGVVGDLSPLGPLQQAVREQQAVAGCASLLGVARENGVAVIHCTAEFRPDRRGSGTNAPLLAAMQGLPGHIESGSAAAQIVPELEPAAADFVIRRLHGVSPFSGTALDATLRNLRADTLLVAGVSVNVGILGLVIEAVNLGYRVIVIEDAVAGFPAQYVADVKRNTLRHLARLMSWRDLAGAWRR